MHRLLQFTDTHLLADPQGLGDQGGYGLVIEAQQQRYPAYDSVRVGNEGERAVARRSLLRHLKKEKRVEDALKLLARKKLLQEYPPLVEKEGVRVAQTEHTIFIHEDRAEVLTHLDHGA